MVPKRVFIGLAIALTAVLAAVTPARAEAGGPYELGDPPQNNSSVAATAGAITVTSPAGDASYAAYPSGAYGFPDRTGTFTPALFEASADPVTVNWLAADVSGDVTIKITRDGETVHSGTVAASAGSYTWHPVVAYGRSYIDYANCRAHVTSVADPSVEGVSPTFAIIPWGTVVQEWNGLKVYSNFPNPNWIAPGVSDIPVFGDSGTGFRYQCVELAQRWTTETQHWQDKNGNPLPSHWAGLYAKDMLTTARATYGLPTVPNDHTATSLPGVGDLLVWDGGQYGHVAVVGAVEGDRLRVYEQNGANPKGTRLLPLGRNSGRVWVDIEGVIGWIKPLQRYSFADIDSSPYRRAIEGLSQAGIISGFADGTFGPDKPVSRQQFAKMIAKTLGLTVTGEEDCPFPDVAGGMDAADPLYPDKYVAVCATRGIVEGYLDGNFGPYQDIRRQQLISMVARAAALPDPPTGHPFSFLPGQFFPAEHYSNARRADYAGLLGGLEGVGPSYDFFGPASRGECAQVLYNLLERR